jgi:uncharacterized membrane protein YbhN (UPF0104 family)
LAAVVVYVHRTFQVAAAQLSQHDWDLRPLWLAAAGTLYVVGLSFMAWFWRRMLAAYGQHVPWPRLLRAYYVGHLGKYVPGKVMVLVLRVGALGRSVDSAWFTLLSTLLETMVMMAVGASLGAAAASVLLPLEPRLTAVVAALAVVVVIPTLPPVARRIARRARDRFWSLEREHNLNEKLTSEHSQVGQRLTWQIWASGCLAALACWILLGLSLWATLKSIGIDGIQPIADLPLTIGAVSLAVVAGFLSFLPGGFVVRDGLLMQLLAPACGEANALVAALLLRLVWLVSELVVCAILYGGMYSSRSR